MGKQKTHEEFVQQVFNLVGDEYEVIGKYINARTKIKMKHKICNHEYDIFPNNFLSGDRCAKCFGNKRKTHQEFCEELKNINPNIDIIGIYKNNKTKILCECKIDNYQWQPYPTNLIKGHGCPKCSAINTSNNLKMPKEEFINKMNIINDKIEILGEYINSRIGILCRCKIDGYEWEPKPNHLLSGHGCPKCKGNLLKTHNEFVEEMLILHPNIEVLGVYKNNHTPIKCKCKIDDYIWNPKPMKLLTRGCPKCGGTLKLTHNEFVNRVKSINQDIEIISKYIAINKHIKCKCKIDGYIWSTTASNLVKNDNPTGCPECNKSKGEKRINNVLINNNWVDIFQKEFEELIDEDKHNKNYFIPQKEFKGLFGLGNGLLSYDFYLPKLNLLIEYQGEQHERYIPGFHKTYDDFLKQLEHDRRKREYAQIHNIKLLEIWYWDFDKIEEILDKELNY